MEPFAEDVIKEIAEQLDCGFQCFIHNETNALLVVPDMDRFYGMDTEAWETELEEIENNFTDYREIKGMESHESFSVMEEFTEALDESNKLKEKLRQSLTGAKPFRNFNMLIHDSTEYREHWFDFKNEKLKEWVRDQLNRKGDA